MKCAHVSDFPDEHLFVDANVCPASFPTERAYADFAPWRGNSTALGGGRVKQTERWRHRGSVPVLFVVCTPHSQRRTPSRGFWALSAGSYGPPDSLPSVSPRPKKKTHDGPELHLKTHTNATQAVRLCACASARALLYNLILMFWAEELCSLCVMTIWYSSSPFLPPHLPSPSLMRVFVLVKISALHISVSGHRGCARSLYSTHRQWRSGVTAQEGHDSQWWDCDSIKVLWPWMSWSFFTSHWLSHARTHART